MKKAIDAVLEAEKQAETAIEDARRKSNLHKEAAAERAALETKEILGAGNKIKAALLERALEEAETHAKTTLISLDREIQSILHMDENIIHETAQKVVGRILYGNP